VFIWQIKNKTCSLFQAAGRPSLPFVFQPFAIVGIGFFIAELRSFNCMGQYRFLLVLLVVCSLPSLLFSQEKPDPEKQDQDSTKAEQIIESIKNSEVSQKLLGTIRKSQGPVKTVKSEDAFKPYEGRIIRKIIVRQVEFGRSVTDTTRNIKNSMIRLGNKIHTDTKEWVIRDNLFIKEGRAINPYKLADNERHLRDLDFLLDAKIYIVPVKGNKELVDVVIMTRDVFSIGGRLSPNTTRTKFQLYDVNLSGGGQRLQFSGLYENDRYPKFTYETFYRKNSIAGTFINGTIGYTQLNNASSYGEEDERAYYLRLDRPLVSPYTRLAGGLEFSKNWSSNFYQVADSLFLNYRYRVNDFWIGYNIGADANTNYRSRHFIAIRVFDQTFTRQPFQNSESKNPLYNHRTYLLGGLTFFKQNFYTSRYIYGFGRTEDVPYGHTMSIYLGWARQLGLERPYLGFDVEKSIVRDNGGFHNYGLRIGSFRKGGGGMEDVTMLLSASVTSRLVTRGAFMFRQIISADFAQIFKQQTALPLDINNEFGIQGFFADSLKGIQRFHINAETIMFTPAKLIGFRFAPFIFGEMAVIAPKGSTIFKHEPYFGLGGGLRTRNENLVFGTIELRFFYYPRITEDISNFKIRVTTNLRVKYTASFVKAPSILQAN
jgi:hypothetical protein